jgi:hypothetical protein
MNQLQLCAKLYAIAGIDQARECIERITKFNFDNGRVHVAPQMRLVNLLPSILVLLVFLPGHAIAASGAITGSSPFQAGLKYDSRGMAPGVLLDSSLFIKSITRIQYSNFRSIPLNIDGRYREES